VQFLLWFGINAITPFLTLFATREAGFSESEAVLLSLVLLLSTAISVWPFGVLSDHIGLKRVFLIGMLLMAGGAVAGTVIRDHLLLSIVLAVAGFGNGAQTASSYPVLTRIVFPEQMGFYTGLNSSITSIAAPASALAAGAIINFTPFGYNALFPFLAVMFLASLIPLSRLRIDQSLYAQARAAAANPPAAP
jgi:MFS family permease